MGRGVPSYSQEQRKNPIKWTQRSRSEAQSPFLVTLATRAPPTSKKKKVRDEAELHVAHGQGPWGNLGRVDGQTTGEAPNGENLWIKG